MFTAVLWLKAVTWLRFLVLRIQYFPMISSCVNTHTIWFWVFSDDLLLYVLLFEIRRENQNYVAYEIRWQYLNNPDTLLFLKLVFHLSSYIFVARKKWMMYYCLSYDIFRWIYHLAKAHVFLHQNYYRKYLREKSRTCLHDVVR